MGKKQGVAKIILDELGGWNEVDEALRQIAECDRNISQIANELNENIDKMKKKSEMQTVAFINTKNALEAQVEAYAAGHKEEIDGKTKVLNFGKVGFRKSTKTTYPGIKSKDLIERLKLQSMHKCVKVTETIILSVLETYPASVLTKLGVKKIESDTFFYETDKEKIKL